jgi:hypothetical protein
MPSQFRTVDAVIPDEFGTVTAAITANMRTIFVKAGYSGPGFTQDQAQSRIETGPGVTFTSDVNFTGVNGSLIMGPGGDIQGEVDVTTGTGCYVRFLNGCLNDGIDINSARNYVNGGGWGTECEGGAARDGISLAGDDCIAENIAAQTDVSSPGNLAGIRHVGTRGAFRLVKVINSDAWAIYHTVGGSYCLTIGCTVVNVANDGMQLQDAGSRVIGNYLNSASLHGIDVTVTGDDAVMVGNIVQDQGNNSISIADDAENCVAVGNRLDGAVSDTSATSTVASNDEEAF